MLTDVIGVDTTARDTNQIRLASAADWDELVDLERTEIGLSGARAMDTVLANHPWLRVVQSVAADQGFFHWDLDFAAVFARGGFDLQVGNPPWVRPDVKMDDLYAELDPWFTLAHKPTQVEKNARRERLDTDSRIRELVYSGAAETVATASVLGNVPDYPHLRDQRPDLYRGFMERTWGNTSSEGIISLIHPESHFTEKKAVSLRRGAYLRLRKHFQYVNELRLFDVHHSTVFGVHVYGQPSDAPSFEQAAFLLHPVTVNDSRRHDGLGPVPGLRNSNGKWDLRPHRDRLQRVGQEEIRSWHSLLEPDDTPIADARMVYIPNAEAGTVLQKITSRTRLRDYRPHISSGWNETTARQKGFFESEWNRPDDWSEVILKGPTLGISNPMRKAVLPSSQNNLDWIEIDLEALPNDFKPPSEYKVSEPDLQRFKKAYGYWDPECTIRQVDTFRLAWKEYVGSVTGSRTLLSGLIPPNSTHVHAINSLWGGDLLAVFAGIYSSSLLADFVVRLAGSGHVTRAIIGAVPTQTYFHGSVFAVENYLRLNCLTEAYAPLWEEVVGEPWDVDTPLRKDEERRAAQVEIDAIVALSLGVTADELCMIYRTQFPVMRRYDQEDRFDANGRKVPKEIVKADAALKDGTKLSVADRTWTHPQSGVEYVYEYPFRQLDREEDMREAYTRFVQSVR
ncbi:hypothetical protein ACUXOC_002093 [Corynebacterium mucifaciens]